ncbi:MAG: ABC transporter ATP-binding protein, partial [Ktedonobacteraceae bacterium]
MKTWRFLWHVIRYQPWLYGIDALGVIVFQQFRIVFGLILQASFNVLARDTRLSPTLWLLLALLVVAALVRFLGYLGAEFAYVLNRFSISALLRRNMLKHILEQPGARALPD